MIIDAFIPRVIGSYYVWPQRVLGVDVTKMTVHAVFITLYRHACTIERTFTETIPLDAMQEYDERVKLVIDTILKQTGPCTIVSAIPSNHVLFKEFSFPFLDYQKIAQLIPYEAAQALPITLANTTIGFIVTHQSSSPAQTTVMVAVAPKDVIEHDRQLYMHPNSEDHHISLAIFALYGLLLKMSHYAQEQHEATFLLYIDVTTTTIACIIGNQLKLIRVVQKGMLHVTRHIAQTLNISPAQAFETVMRFGLPNKEHSHVHSSIADGMDSIFNDIIFTIESIKNMVPQGITLKKAILVGPSCDIGHITPYASAKLGIQAEAFDMHHVLKMTNVKSQFEAHVLPSQLVALALAMPNDVTRDFSLNRESQSRYKSLIFKTQLIFGCSLIGLLFLTVLTTCIWQIRSLTSTANSLENAVVRHLQSTGLSSKKNIKQALDEATANVSKEEDLWFAFSQGRRFSFLEMLQVLSAAVDRKGLGLTLKKLTLTGLYVEIEGEVRDFEALQRLERALKQTQLFVTVPPLQELHFNEKLLLKKN